MRFLQEIGAALPLHKKSDPLPGRLSQPGVAALWLWWFYNSQPDAINVALSRGTAS
jgi:hypothetical protein